MFIKFKIFLKKYFHFIYPFLHHTLFPIYLKMYRSKKLKSFTGEHMKNFDYNFIKFKILLNKINGFVDEEIYANGVYEPEILNLYKENIKKGDVYVDIGTNIGQHALYAAAIVGTEGRVVCFEPIKSIFDQLEKSKNENNFHHMQLVNKAIGKDEGEIEIYKNKNNMGASSIALQKGDFKETIKITKGAELMELNKIDFIKIDTEGYEYEVLLSIEGAVNKYNPKILFEFTPEFYGTTLDEKVKILNYFKDKDYIMYDLEDNNKVINNSFEWLRNFHKLQTNIFCVKN